MIGSDDLDSLLNDLEERMGSDWNWGPCCHFMIDCLNLVRPQLPSVAVEALTIQESFMEGIAPYEQVIAARERCWRANDREATTHPVSNLRITCIRAVICVLWNAPAPGDSLGHLAFFLGLLNQVEPRYNDEYRLLCKHFGAYIS
jgi:hypothetical protein